ncbi:MoaD/ThiS family protein [Geobacter sp.]|uniref:MoaD/ThiS family protein n=1 Tax=Geobacter sp. TaxID=46610 RepID=UPI00261C3639|nr:MoaD/ThiS family protein [Geobacter sp.]
MNITVKLFATFRAGRFDIESRTYAEGTTVGDVVRELNLSEKELGIMLVNSRHVKLDHRLEEGDTLSLFPLLGGG